MPQKNNNEPLVQREKNLTKPHFPKRGWLKNGNPPGDFTKASRCGAKGKRTGLPCQQPAMVNGRCRLHGGKSTGPRTAEGLKQSQKANWKHGEYSRETKEELRAMRKAMATLLNPEEALQMTPEEIHSHTITMNRLLHKLNTGQL